MIRVEHNGGKRTLEKDYLKVFAGWNFSKKLTGLKRRNSPKISFVTFPRFDAEKILTYSFSKLVGIYYQYLAWEEKHIPDVKERKKFRAKLANIYKYSNKWDSKIAAFFSAPANGFVIHTCHYCDMAYINTYSIEKVVGKKRKTKTEINRQYDLDHVLDKAKCPIIALSLYNFVPACTVCNERIKGGKLIGGNKSEVLILSPTNPHFDFDKNVQISLDAVDGTAEFSNYLDNAWKYELEFYATPPYDVFVLFFHLKERYNYHITEALRLRDLKDKYPDANIEMIAGLFHRTKEEVYEDIFGKDFTDKYHRCLSKLRRDILK